MSGVPDDFWGGVPQVENPEPFVAIGDRGFVWAGTSDLAGWSNSLGLQAVETHATDTPEIVAASRAAPGAIPSSLLPPFRVLTPNVRDREEGDGEKDSADHCGRITPFTPRAQP